MSHLSFADFRAGTMRIASARVDLVYLQVFSNFDFFMIFDDFSPIPRCFDRILIRKAPNQEPRFKSLFKLLKKLKFTSDPGTQYGTVF